MAEETRNELNNRIESKEEKEQIKAVITGSATVDSIERIIEPNELIEAAKENELYNKMFDFCDINGIKLSQLLIDKFENVKVRPDQLKEEIMKQMSVIIIDINRSGKPIYFDENGNMNLQKTLEKGEEVSTNVLVQEIVGDIKNNYENSKSIFEDKEALDYFIKLVSKNSYLNTDYTNDFIAGAQIFTGKTAEGRKQEVISNAAYSKEENLLFNIIMNTAAFVQGIDDDYANLNQEQRNLRSADLILRKNEISKILEQNPDIPEDLRNMALAQIEAMKMVFRTTTQALNMDDYENVEKFAEAVAPGDIRFKNEISKVKSEHDDRMDLIRNALDGKDIELYKEVYLVNKFNNDIERVAKMLEQKNVSINVSNLFAVELYALQEKYKSLLKDCKDEEVIANFEKKMVGAESLFETLTNSKFNDFSSMEKLVDKLGLSADLKKRAESIKNEINAGIDSFALMFDEKLVIDINKDDSIMKEQAEKTKQQYDVEKIYKKACMFLELSGNDPKEQDRLFSRLEKEGVIGEKVTREDVLKRYETDSEIHKYSEVFRREAFVDDVKRFYNSDRSKRTKIQDIKLLARSIYYINNEMTIKNFANDKDKEAWKMAEGIIRELLPNAKKVYTQEGKLNEELLKKAFVEYAQKGMAQMGVKGTTKYDKIETLADLNEIVKSEDEAILRGRLLVSMLGGKEKNRSIDEIMDSKDFLKEIKEKVEIENQVLIERDMVVKVNKDFDDLCFRYRQDKLINGEKFDLVDKLVLIVTWGENKENPRNLHMDKHMRDNAKFMIAEMFPMAFDNNGEVDRDKLNEAVKDYLLKTDKLYFNDLYNFRGRMPVEDIDVVSKIIERQERSAKRDFNQRKVESGSRRLERSNNEIEEIKQGYESGKIVEDDKNIYILFKYIEKSGLVIDEKSLELLENINTETKQRLAKKVDNPEKLKSVIKDAEEISNNKDYCENMVATARRTIVEKKFEDISKRNGSLAVVSKDDAKEILKYYVGNYRYEKNVPDENAAEKRVEKMSRIWLKKVGIDIFKDSEKRIISERKLLEVYNNTFGTKFKSLDEACIAEENSLLCEYIDIAKKENEILTTRYETGVVKSEQYRKNGEDRNNSKEAKAKNKREELRNAVGHISVKGVLKCATDIDVRTKNYINKTVEKIPFDKMDMQPTADRLIEKFETNNNELTREEQQQYVKDLVMAVGILTTKDLKDINSKIADNATKERDRKLLDISSKKLKEVFPELQNVEKISLEDVEKQYINYLEKNGLEIPKGITDSKSLMYVLAEQERTYLDANDLYYKGSMSERISKDVERLDQIAERDQNKLISQEEMDNVIEALSEELQVVNPGEKMAEEISNAEQDIPEISDEEAKDVIESKSEEMEVGNLEEIVVEPKDKQISDEEAKPAFDKTSENVIVADEKGEKIVEESETHKVEQGEEVSTVVAESITINTLVEEEKSLVVQNKNPFKSMLNRVSSVVKNAIKNVTERIGITSNNTDSSNSDANTSTSSSGGINKEGQDSSVKNLTGYEKIELTSIAKQEKTETTKDENEKTEAKDDEIEIG